MYLAMLNCQCFPPKQICNCKTFWCRWKFDPPQLSIGSNEQCVKPDTKQTTLATTEDQHQRSIFCGHYKSEQIRQLLLPGLTQASSGQRNSFLWTLRIKSPSVHVTWTLVHLKTLYQCIQIDKCLSIRNFKSLHVQLATAPISVLQTFLLANITDTLKIYVMHEPGP